MPWWGWILVVLAGIGLAMFPVQVLALAKRVPREVWLAIAGLLLLFFVYRIGYQVRDWECKAENKAAQDAADKEAAKQVEAAPKVAEDAKKSVQPVIEERVIYVNKNNTVSCDEPYSDGVQSEIHKAEATIDRLRSRGNPKDGKADD